MRRLSAGGGLALADLLPQVHQESQRRCRSQSDEKPDADAHPEVQSVLHRYPLSATHGLGVQQQSAQIGRSNDTLMPAAEVKGCARFFVSLCWQGIDFHLRGAYSRSKSASGCRQRIGPIVPKEE